MACMRSCVLLLTLLAVTLALNMDLASAKPALTVDVVGFRSAAARGAYPLRRRFTARGCSSFGHSCFGGHGKRSDEEFPAAVAPEYQVEPDLGSERSAVDNRPGDIVPLLRQWLQLQSYRRLSESNGN